MKKTLSPFKSPNPSKKYTPIQDYTPIESAEALKKLIIDYPPSLKLTIKKRDEEGISIFNELFADLKNKSDPLLLERGCTAHDPNHLYLFPLGTELIKEVLRDRKQFTFGSNRSKYSSSISSALFKLRTNPGYGPSKQMSYLLKSSGQGDSFEDEKNRRASEDLTDLEIDETVFSLKESTVREKELNQIYDFIISCDCRLTKRSPASNKNIEDISGAITDLLELRGDDFSFLKEEKDTIEFELNELKIFKEGDSEEGTDISFEQLPEELLKIKQELAEAKKSNELDKTFRQQELTDLTNELGINFYPKKEFTAKDLSTGIGNLKDALEKLNLELEDLKLKIEQEKKEAADAVKVEKEKTEKAAEDAKIAKEKEEKEKAAEDAKGPIEKFYDALKKHSNENPGKKILSPSGVSFSDLRKMEIDPKSLGNSLSPTANSSTRGGK